MHLEMTFGISIHVDTIDWSLRAHFFFNSKVSSVLTFKWKELVVYEIIYFSKYVLYSNLFFISCVSVSNNQCEASDEDVVPNMYFLKSNEKLAEDLNKGPAVIFYLQSIRHGCKISNIV